MQTRNLVLLFSLMLSIGYIQANVSKLVCYYDASSYIRKGLARLTMDELHPALQFCNYLVYGYAGIDKETFQLKPLNANLDVSRDHYHAITDLKRNYPQLRVLLSVGGDKDIESDPDNQKYLLLLEDVVHRQTFVNSAANVIRTYGFDGLDLAWQFPKNPPKVVRSGLKKAWNTFKGWFTSDKLVDEKGEEHRMQFTLLVRELRGVLRQESSVLTLTVLPHVNPTLFFDIPTIMAYLDFVNLATFDYQTPERDPKVADYPAPLYALYDRPAELNINHSVQYWLNNSAPADKLNIGIAAYGRAWVMGKESGITGFPPIPETEGPAPAGKQFLIPGLLSWREICEMLITYKELTDDKAPLRMVGDPTQRYGTYAYRAADDNGLHGMWVGYETATTASIKAAYVHAKGLGGVALFDLSLDDFRGDCAGEKFPILRGIKYKL